MRRVLTTNHVQCTRIHELVEIKVALIDFRRHVLHHDLTLLVEDGHVALQDLKAEAGIQELAMRLPGIPFECHQTATVAQQVDEIVDIISIQALLAVENGLDSARILEQNVEPRAQPKPHHSPIFIKDAVDDLQVVCEWMSCGLSHYDRVMRVLTDQPRP